MPNKTNEPRRKVVSIRGTIRIDVAAHIEASREGSPVMLRADERRALPVKINGRMCSHVLTNRIGLFALAGGNNSLLHPSTGTLISDEFNPRNTADTRLSSNLLPEHFHSPKPRPEDSLQCVV